MYLQWASFYLDQNDPAAAQDFLTRAQPLATTPELKGTLFHHRGRLALARGDTGQALDMFTQALTIDRSVLDRAAMAADLFSLGEVYQTRGELAEAWDYYVRAFDVYAGLGKKSQLARCLKRLQEVNRQGQMGHSLERFEKLANPKPFLIFSDIELSPRSQVALGNVYGCQAELGFQTREGQTHGSAPSTIRFIISFPSCIWERP